MAGPCYLTDLLKHQQNAEQEVSAFHTTRACVRVSVFGQFHETGHKQHYSPDLGLQ